MTFPLALIDDADADVGGGVGGVQIHVEIAPLSTPPPIDGLAGTGADLPMLLIAAGVALLIVGAILLARRVRRRSAG
ncbi:LPXTG cell wall anchor domain-containing protein [Microbacterium sp. SSW1-49]|uniref:LPXTG cell wall anchor domain-containing protein n=1 Tax=Microbacterium croceum TaxID=2851645 RepID=A0ABT0F974_9MICO|nr:LPXTG cell wall anchor domain-containing protein [Microbacterium croceum]MCK2034586.1 LPXTG cell wall anchor domain-containing protein [Microbacterium croceum]